jgi:phosphoserine aminotransferase
MFDHRPSLNWRFLSGQPQWDAGEINADRLGSRHLCRPINLSVEMPMNLDREPISLAASEPRQPHPVALERDFARVFNFAAGPSMLPFEILEHVREELTDWRGSGMSVMEVSHRSKAFLTVAQELESLLRELAGIPTHYKVLFPQGGATTQFSAIPLNLAKPHSVAEYINTGIWSIKAIAEAGNHCKVHIAADSIASSYTNVPDSADLQLSADSSYVHYTPNETIGGVEFPYVPNTATVPLVADMSSTVLSRPIDVTKFGVIYAGAQKNLGIAGLTIVIAREDLIGRARPGTPVTLDYAAIAGEGSMVNTPPTFAWYVASLVLKWIKAQGGLSIMAERNGAKADALYRAIDRTGFYRNPVSRNCRSRMNIPFTLVNSQLDQKFLSDAKNAGLVNLEGHRSMGGMRASLYNAMPMTGVQTLTDFMADFERRHG